MQNTKHSIFIFYSFIRNFPFDGIQNTSSHAKQYPRSLQFSLNYYYNILWGKYTQESIKFTMYMCCQFIDFSRFNAVTNCHFYDTLCIDVKCIQFI